MKDEEKFKHYLLDLSRLIKEYARTAVEEREKQRGQATQGFYDGYVLGFHRVVSLMQQQALAFGIEVDGIALHSHTSESWEQTGMACHPHAVPGLGTAASCNLCQRFEGINKARMQPPPPLQ